MNRYECPFKYLMYETLYVETEYSQEKYSIWKKTETHETGKIVGCFSQHKKRPWDKNTPKI